jgi:hypothetical protein
MPLGIACLQYQYLLTQLPYCFTPLLCHSDLIASCPALVSTNVSTILPIAVTSSHISDGSDHPLTDAGEIVFLKKQLHLMHFIVIQKLSVLRVKGVEPTFAMAGFPSSLLTYQCRLWSKTWQ